MITTVNPTTGKPLAEHRTFSRGEIEAAISRADRAAPEWASMDVSERAQHLRSFASALRRELESLARLATDEMGKPITEARSEIEKCAWSLEVVATQAPAVLARQPISAGSLDSYVAFEPLGVILAIMPWNFPYWQVIRAGGPALAAGNCVLLKHADNVTGCAKALSEVALSAGLPEGVLSLLVTEVDSVAEVIADKRISGVTLTGSTRAGRAVAAEAGMALKKTVLELGGSDPFIVLDDADVEAAAAWAVRSRFQNTGQSCIAAKRAVVMESAREQFVEALLAEVAKIVMGDPHDESTTLGPMARDDLRDALVRQVASSVAEGARVISGGRSVEGPGWFHEPTVLDRVESGMPVLEEEVFGPVLPLVVAASEDHAIDIANATSYGLGSALWSSDLDHARSLARRLRAGHTAINGMTASDPRLPFGGVKDSGYGRELSHFGMVEFVNCHAVTVEPRGGPAASRGVATE